MDTDSVIYTQKPTKSARHIQHKWKADDKMVATIDALPGPKSYMEKLSRHIIAAKRGLHL